MRGERNNNCDSFRSSNFSILILLFPRHHLQKNLNLHHITFSPCRYFTCQSIFFAICHFYLTISFYIFTFTFILSHFLFLCLLSLSLSLFLSLCFSIFTFTLFFYHSLIPFSFSFLSFFPFSLSHSFSHTFSFFFSLSLPFSLSHSFSHTFSFFFLSLFHIHSHSLTLSRSFFPLSYLFQLFFPLFSFCLSFSSQIYISLHDLTFDQYLSICLFHIPIWLSTCVCSHSLQFDIIKYQSFQTLSIFSKFQ